MLTRPHEQKRIHVFVHKQRGCHIGAQRIAIVKAAQQSTVLPIPNAVTIETPSENCHDGRNETRRLTRSYLAR